MLLVVQLPSRVRCFETPCIAAHQVSLSLTISQSLPKVMSAALVMPSSHLILWHPLLLLPSVFSSIRDFSNELSVWVKWPKYWSFSFTSVLPVKIQGWSPLRLTGLTFRSLLQHHSLKSSILWRSASFMLQLSQPNVTSGKTIALTIQTFVDSVTSAFQHTV